MNPGCIWPLLGCAFGGWPRVIARDQQFGRPSAVEKISRENTVAIDSKMISEIPIQLAHTVMVSI